MLGLGFEIEIGAGNWEFGMGFGSWEGKWELGIKNLQLRTRTCF